MNRKLLNDLSYLKTMTIEVARSIMEEDDRKKALYMLSDMIIHIDAFIEEDLQEETFYEYCARDIAAEEKLRKGDK